VTALFLQAVQLEESGRIDEAAEEYEQVLHLDPHHAPSSINLGTICYNRRAFRRAEELYRRATIADPGYALAFFDLGNVLDELERLPDAIEAYRSAIRLVPKYADAHYNLALAYERTGERRRALRHWTMYLKLDPVGPWANHARSQARKILSREKLTIVHRSPWVLRTRTDARAAAEPQIIEHGPSLPA
jgi:tetratricopeptide (TPR) repeat protein